MKDFLTGNEAIARGAYEGNVWVATGYPGTPSSEIIETITNIYPEINSEWSVNEKTALETALGSSIAGVRSIVTMKHVGLNVAADPLMTASYTGVNAGLVIVVADDPSLYSSQNEQDTRNYAKFAKIPLLEPCNSQEAKEFTKIGLEISENFDTPVILRPVTRVSHTRCVVNLDEPKRKIPEFNYQKNSSKYVMIPSYALPRHNFVIERYKKLQELSNKFEYNTIEYNKLDIGIITHGLIYNYVKEIFKDASIFKISMYPIPIEKIIEFASKVKNLYIVEELDAIIEQEVRSLGIKVIGKEIIPLVGELSTSIIKKSFQNIGFKFDEKDFNIPTLNNIDIPVRPPVLCKGCGHISVFEVLNELNLIVLGDIGCYTLGVFKPYEAMDTCICMGAGVGNEIGFKKVAKLTNTKIKSVAVIGDSTFFHSGMTNLLNAVYNKVPITVLILDNRITGMTGHQPNPSTGLTNKFNPVENIDLINLVKGLGVRRVRKENAYKKQELKSAILEELEANEPSVIIVEEKCVIWESRYNKIKNLIKN